MRDLGISKGEFKVAFLSDNRRGVRCSDGFVALLPKPTRYSGQDERYEKELNENKADSELIADAFNTANQCGILPSELLKQRDHLLDVMKDFANQYTAQDEGQKDFLWMAVQLINEIEK